MEESKPTFNLLQYTTIFYGFSILLGYSYIDSYYNKWGIQIYSYLDASEILLSFLNIFNTFLFGIVAILLSFIPVFILPSKRNSEVREKIINKYPFLKRKIHPIFIIILMSAIVIYDTYKLFYTYDFRTLFILLFLSIVIFYIILNLNIDYLSKNNNLSKNFIQIILFVLLSYSLINIGAIYQFRRVKENFVKTSFSFTYELKTYNSNDSLIYIGATSKYIFINNTKSKTNLIFEKGSIKNLALIETSKK